MNVLCRCCWLLRPDARDTGKMHAFASRRLAAFAEVSTALANGELQPFRSGSSRILAVNPVQMALSGLWGSFFSRIGLYAAPPLATEAATPERLWSIVQGVLDTKG